MAITYITSGYNQSTNENDASVTIDSTGANLLVLSLSVWKGRGAYSFTDNKGNTWTALTQYGSISPQTKQWYCLNPTSVGSSHTLSITGATSGSPSIVVHAFSGVGAFHSEGGANANSTSVTTATLTPSSDGALFVAALSIGFSSGSDAGAGTYTGFAMRNQTGFAMGLAYSYYIQPTAAGAAETFTGNTGERQTSHCCFTAASTASPIVLFDDVLSGGFHSFKSGAM